MFVDIVMSFYENKEFRVTNFTYLRGNSQLIKLKILFARTPWQ